MKLKLIAATISSLLVVGCAFSPHASDRRPAYQNDEASSSMCAEDFQKAGQRFLLLAQQNQSVYQDLLQRQLGEAVQRTQVRCSAARVAPYGVQIAYAPEGAQIQLETGLASLSNLFESDLGRQGLVKFKVNPRTAYHDRVMVALAAHSYSLVLGIDDANYDRFFQTLKILDQN